MACNYVILHPWIPVVPSHRCAFAGRNLPAKIHRSLRFGSPRYKEAQQPHTFNCYHTLTAEQRRTSLFKREGFL
jgi:hypothetical protein